ncbi:476_t:CDS:2, partial [Rhizophagus irregularis]
MCIREIDNTKANLHGILLMIIIVKTLACVKIKTGKLLIDLITDFINEDSKWEELKKENDEGNNLSAFSNKEVGIKLELMQLDFNIYTLRWNKNIIYGDYRNYLKKFNQINENSKSEYDVLIDTLIEIENKYNTPEEEVNYKIIRTLAKEIVTFMMAPSTILILGNQKRSREVTRELFNDGLYKICNDKSERRIIEEVWGKFYLKVRQEIWLDRCNKINEIEK